MGFPKSVFKNKIQASQCFHLCILTYIWVINAPFLFLTNITTSTFEIQQDMYESKSACDTHTTYLPMYVYAHTYKNFTNVSRSKTVELYLWIWELKFKLQMFHRFGLNLMQRQPLAVLLILYVTAEFGSLVCLFWISIKTLQVTA